MTDPGVPAPADAGLEPDDADPHPAAASSEPPPTAMVRPTGRRLPVAMGAIVIGVVAVDHLTKWWAQRVLADRDAVHVVGSLLKLTLTYNSGMAFSRGRGLGPVIGVVALVVIVVLLASLRRESSLTARVALAAVIGGAVGNIGDRLFRSGDGFMGGSVVDFLQLPHWPVFNVADMAVTLGGLTLVLGAWRSGRHARAAAGPGAPRSEP